VNGAVQGIYVAAHDVKAHARPESSETLSAVENLLKDQV